MNLGKLVENNKSKILGEKLAEKQLTENSPAENSQVQKIISAKYSGNFVIVLCYEVLIIMKYYTVNCKFETFQAII